MQGAEVTPSMCIFLLCSWLCAQNWSPAVYGGIPSGSGDWDQGWQVQGGCRAWFSVFDLCSSYSQSW